MTELPKFHMMPWVTFNGGNKATFDQNGAPAHETAISKSTQIWWRWRRRLPSDNGVRLHNLFISI